LFLGDLLDQSKASKIINNSESIVFSTEVSNPERYGVIVFDSNNDTIEIIEKPKFTNSKSVITGLYFYDSNATEIAKKLKASPRGELEITDLNNYYLKNSNLKVINLKKSCVWLDAGTFETLSDAAQIVKGMKKDLAKNLAVLRRYVSI
jgi:glucose-1-phosphate thymidylyltransferase